MPALKSSLGAHVQSYVSEFASHMYNVIMQTDHKDINPCHAEEIKKPCPFLTVNQSDYLIHIVDINSHTEWQTVQMQISWLLQKPTDLDLHCLQRQGISGFSSARVKSMQNSKPTFITVLSVFLSFLSTFFWASFSFFKTAAYMKKRIVEKLKISIHTCWLLLGPSWWRICKLNPCPAEPGYTLPLLTV